MIAREDLGVGLGGLESGPFNSGFTTKRNTYETNIFINGFWLISIVHDVQ